MVLTTVVCVQRSPISFSARGKGNVPFPRATKEIGDVCNLNLNLKQFLSKI